MSTTDDRAASLVGKLRDLTGNQSLRSADVRVVRAPGRLNLIGEHTDYNDGLVMPVAINLETWAASVPRRDGTVRIASLQESEIANVVRQSVGPGSGTWVDYVCGVTSALADEGVPLRSVDAIVDSDIPVGAGLSSSAALELAVAWTVLADVPPSMAQMEFAKAAQRAENEYVGVKSGLMDQFAASHGRAGHALLLDCRSLEFEEVPIPASLELVALDTRSPHRLGTSEYNARREQCAQGVRAIAARYPGVRSLRDVTPEMLDDAADLVDDETIRRCRHVVDETQRVLATREAFRSGDMARIGRLFAASHASLRDLYEVSSPELDALVEIAAGVRGVIAARMTGAGFGGCTVNLVERDAVQPLRDAVGREFPRRFGREAGFYHVRSVDGAGLV